ncbi:MAG: CRISPR-associated protein Cas4 [Methanobacterium sp.]
MLNVSEISEFVYCPVKLYLKYTEDIEVQKSEMIAGKVIHDARRGFEDILKHNTWNVTKDMDIAEIQRVILKGVPEYLDKLQSKYLDYYKVDKENLNKFFKELKEDLIIEASINVLKIKKLLKTTDKQGREISEMLFPQSLSEFTLENQDLNLKGKVDKIEIINGIYYPVEIKSSFPPSKGTWLSDSLQIAAYSLLMSYELNKEVFVGFVYYTKIFERRTVVINSILHNKLIEVLDSINMMFEKDEIPEFKRHKNKCMKCEYLEICGREGLGN